MHDPTLATNAQVERLKKRIEELEKQAKALIVEAQAKTLQSNDK